MTGTTSRTSKTTAPAPAAVSTPSVEVPVPLWATFTVEDARRTLSDADRERYLTSLEDEVREHGKRTVALNGAAALMFHNVVVQSGTMKQGAYMKRVGLASGSTGTLLQRLAITAVTLGCDTGSDAWRMVMQKYAHPLVVAALQGADTSRPPGNPANVAARKRLTTLAAEYYATTPPVMPTVNGEGTPDDGSADADETDAGTSTVAPAVLTIEECLSLLATAVLREADGKPLPAARLALVEDALRAILDREVTLASKAASA